MSSTYMPTTAAEAGRASVQTLIEPRRTGLLPRIRDLWTSRRLLIYFAGRSVRRMYARTILGFVWIPLRPLFPIVAGTLVFGGLVGIRTTTVPYFLFFLVGMSLWQVFDASLMWVTRSLEMNRRLVTRMYFPRLVLPIANMAPPLMEFLIHVLIMIVAFAYYAGADGVLYLRLGLGTLASITAIAMTLLLAIGIGLWTCVWATTGRDVRWSLRYVTGIWFFMTPVIYPVELVPDAWRPAAMLNPLATWIEMFRWGILGVGGVYWTGFAFSVAILLVVFSSGLWYFSRAEGRAVDRL